MTHYKTFINGELTLIEAEGTSIVELLSKSADALMYACTDVRNLLVHLNPITYEDYLQEKEEMLYSYEDSLCSQQ